MNSRDYAFLTTALGVRVLADLAAADLSDAGTLGLLTRLRKTLAPEQAAAAVEQAKLRVKAAAKFGADAERMFFTRDGLEQASDPRIRRYRAAEASGRALIIDACCGIGTDALSFAAAPGERRTVLGLDLDAVRVEVARYNAAALGLDNARFEVLDVTRPLPETAELVFFDPARRDSNGRRLQHVEQYLPALSSLKAWDAPYVWAKLSPAVDLDETRAYGGLIEFHSVDGDLKEAMLRINRIPTPASAFDGQLTSAIRHDAGGAEVWKWRKAPPAVDEREPRGWLLEPDPALMRAGYVQHLAAQLGAAQLDATIAYLTIDARPDTPWARAWEILDWMPFSLKRLKATLRAQGVGRVTVKKRGHAMTPEDLQAALRLDGKGEERVVVLTRVKGQPAVIICR